LAAWAGAAHEGELQFTAGNCDSIVDAQRRWNGHASVRAAMEPVTSAATA